MSLPTLYEYYTASGITSGLSASQPYFTLNNKNITLYSGAMHYFRVPREYWSDRLRKMRAAGLNAVETYIPWNLHEPEPGHYDFGKGGSDFQDFLDIEVFLNTAKQEDLFAIVRPGPYICAEWEFGGLPSWLLRKQNIQMRTSDRSFMHYVETYFRMLLPILALLQFANGGPIIAFQIENEYGSLRRRDYRYLKHLKKVFKRNGITELLFTSDGPSVGNLGQMPDTLFAGNFQTEAQLELNILQSYQPGKPLMVMEYWTGWFDHWGEVHNRIQNEEFFYTLGMILKFPASVNLYMFHGGTSFGFMNGANLVSRDSDNESYQPDTTSYDYDAPLSECGDYTEKYYSTKKLIARYNQIKTYLPRMPQEFKRAAYTKLDIIEQLDLEELICQSITNVSSYNVIPMEMLPINNNAGQSYGYIVYRKRNLYIPSNSVLMIEGRVCDTVIVLINGVLKSKVLETMEDWKGFGYWKQKDSTLTIDNEYMNATLDLLVENWGRVNFGALYQYMQYKGLWQGSVWLNNNTIKNWEIIPLEFKSKWTNSLQHWSPTKYYVGPCLYKSILVISDNPLDTFIDMREWIKGIVIVNGFVLCRYLKLGPQQACYLPGPFLNKGRNEILIFEHFESADYVKFVGNQLFQNIQNKQEMYTKTISIYIEE